MGASRGLFTVFVLLFPLAIDIPSPPSDSTRTRVALSGGNGGYALVGRGCEGQVLRKDRVDFREAEIAIDHRLDEAIRLGVRGGVIRARGPQTPRENRYVNPTVSIGSRGFEVGGGPVFSRHPFPTGGYEESRIDGSGHLRIGPEDYRYFFVSYMESQPLYSGGGYLSIGLGGRPRPNLGFSAALSIRPYDRAGAALGAEFRPAPRLAAQMHVRLGGSERIGENAVSLGLSYSLGHRTPPPASRPFDPPAIGAARAPRPAASATDPGASGSAPDRPRR
jgi:hypothetical protein